MQTDADINNDVGFEVGSGADRIKIYEEITPTKLQRNMRLYVDDMTTARIHIIRIRRITR
jgi:hypothetical protein